MICAARGPGGRTTQTEYCPCGRPSTVIDAAGQRTVSEFDGSNRLVATTLPNGARTEYTYERINGQDLVVAVRDALGKVSRSEYDAAGHLVKQIDPLGRETRFSLDVNGRVVRVDFPGGGFSLTQYDSLGRVSQTQNARGATTRFVYDDDGRLIRTISPDGSSTAQAYDNQGRVVSRTRTDGGVEQLVYDAAGQLTATIDPLGHVSRTEYAKTGTVSRVVDPRDKATVFRYDSLDRLVETVTPLGYTTRQSYTTDGETDVTVNANGAQTRFRYDVLGRLEAATDPLGFTVERSYDSVGNVVSVRDENRNQWGFTFDLLSRKLSETDPNNRTTHYQYNAAGELSLVMFADGSKWRYTRDAAGRVTARQLEKLDGTVEDTERFGYDLVGNRILSENASVKTTSAFDLMDRETQRTLTYKSTGSTRTLSFLYDSMGRRQIMVDSHGRVTGYTYDKLSRPTAITIAEPLQGACGLDRPFRTRTYVFTWDAASNLVQVDYPNQTRTRRVFDASNRLTELVHERVEGKKVSTLQRFTYTRDKVGNITQVVNERGETFRYGYDARDQLVRALMPKSMLARLRAGNHSCGMRRDPGDGEPPEEEREERLLRAEDVRYTYDPAGNRLEENYGGRVIRATYSPANEMLTRGRLTYRYDDRGNQVETSGPGFWHQVFGYSVAGRLTSLSKEYRIGRRNFLKEVERYQYSTENERVGIEDKAFGMRTQFVWDGGRPIEEWQEVGRGSNKADVGILYARDLGGQLLDQVRFTQRWQMALADLAGGILDDREDEDQDPGPRTPKLRHVRWIMPDHLGSTSLITNAQGHRLDRLQYGPWGEALGGNHWRTRFTYTGHQREARTGNYYSVYRYLDPQAGRWTQRDPLGASDGINRFLYVRNQPSGGIDRLGLKVNLQRAPADVLAVLLKSSTAGALWGELNDNTPDWEFNVEFRELAGVMFPYEELRELRVADAVSEVENNGRGLRFGETRPTEQTGSSCPKYRVKIYIFSGSLSAFGSISSKAADELISEQAIHAQSSRRTIRRLLHSDSGFDPSGLSAAIASVLVHELKHGWMRAHGQYNKNEAVPNQAQDEFLGQSGK